MSNRTALIVKSPLLHNRVRFKPGAEFKGSPPEKFEGDQKTVTNLVRLGVLRQESVNEDEDSRNVKTADGGDSPKKNLAKMNKTDLIETGKELDPDFDETLSNEKMRERISELEAEQPQPEEQSEQSE